MKTLKGPEQINKYLEDEWVDEIIDFIPPVELTKDSILHITGITYGRGAEEGEDLDCIRDILDLITTTSLKGFSHTEILAEEISEFLISNSPELLKFIDEIKKGW